MSAILGIKRTLVHQPEISLVDQGRTLQRMSGTFPLEMTSRDIAEFLVDERDQSLKRFMVARLPTYQQLANRMGMLLIHSQLQPQTK